MVWERKSALGSLLLESSDWEVVYDDTTATKPDDVDAKDWDRMVDEKPFLVACKVTFDRWNKPVTITAPSGAINIDQLQAGG